MKRDENRTRCHQATKTMKTKMLHLAAAISAAVLLGPVALAGPDHPIKRQTSGPATKTDCCMTHGACKGIACCENKMKAAPARSGRSSHSAFKKERVCNSNCSVAGSDKSAVCRTGTKS